MGQGYPYSRSHSKSMSLPIKACLQADLDCIFNQQVVLDMKQQGQIPPGLFLHQLYNRDIMPMSTDNINLHSAVDQSVNDWIARGWLMRFHLPSIQSDFLMTWRDYEQWLHGILGPSPSPLLRTDFIVFGFLGKNEFMNF